MKQLILSTLISCASLSVFAQQETPKPVPATPVPGQMPQTQPEKTMNPEFVQFKEVSYNFGNIKQNEPPTHVFTFKNVGDKDISLVNVQASCGCTTPNWKGGIYKPGESGEIKATYNAASEGFFSKVITVTTSEGVITLNISGTVLNAQAYEEWKATQPKEEPKKAEPAAKPAKKATKKSATTKTKKETSSAVKKASDK